MQRRSLVAGLALSALAKPALAQPARARTLVFVPQANLTSLDPIWTTATVTRNYAYLVFDTLYGTDDALQPRPQMAEGQEASDDGRRWTIRLREGLSFHDGTPVLARDCVASLARWMRRDSLGGTILGLLDGMDAPDDRTLELRLKRPFPPLLNALAKTQPSPAMIMPERIALTDPFKQITEVVGSGPFRFVADEYVSGSRVVFAKYAGYRPREDAPSSVAGGKRAMVDRVEWRVIPEAQTAVNALRAGEVDWLEMPIPDLIPTLKRDPGVVVGRLDPYGCIRCSGFNHLHGPTTNRGVRRAMLAAIDPREVMQAVMGDDAGTYNAPGRMFPAWHPLCQRCRHGADRGWAQRGRVAGHAAGRRLWRGAGGAVASHGPALLRRHEPGLQRGVEAGGGQCRRCGHGLGNRGPAPDQQGAAGSRRLVAVLHVVPGAGLHRPAFGAGPARDGRHGLVWLAYRWRDRDAAGRLDRRDGRDGAAAACGGDPGGGAVRSAVCSARPVFPIGRLAVQHHGPSERAAAAVLERLEG